MKKKGFTLIELLAVIIILAVIALIVTPIVLNVVDSAKESARKSSVAGFADAMKLGVSDYMFQNSGELPTIDEDFQKTYNSKGESVICEGVYSTDSYGIVLHNCKVGTDTTNYCFAKGNHYACDDTTYNSMLEYAKNGVKPEVTVQPNAPELLDNMIPVRHDGTNWVYANTSQEWYNYDKKEWANAVILKSGLTKTVGQTITEEDIALWYVWIPRYKYTIFNGNNESVPEQQINVVFEKGTSKTGTVECTDAVSGSGSSSETCTDSTNGSIINGISMYTHPAFTFGDKELTGIWIGKFENSGSTSNMTIIPNVSSLRNTNVSSFFTGIQRIKTKYGISNGDSHMMTNMEWGATAYFKQSEYGLGITDIGINNYSSFKTGCGATAGSKISSTCDAYNTTNGMLASTTGNIYGIYDMSGGAWEYVMGNMVNSIGEFYSSKSGFSSTPDGKYYTAYTYDGSPSPAHSRGKLGDATKETLSTYGSYTGGWYSDYAYFVSASDSWFLRGGNSYNGSGAGVFYFNYNSGVSYSDYGSRSVLVSE